MTLEPHENDRQSTPATPGFWTKKRVITAAVAAGTAVVVGAGVAIAVVANAISAPTVVADANQSGDDILAEETAADNPGALPDVGRSPSAIPEVSANPEAEVSVFAPISAEITDPEMLASESISLTMTAVNYAEQLVPEGQLIAGAAADGNTVKTYADLVSSVFNVQGESGARKAAQETAEKAVAELAENYFVEDWETNPNLVGYAAYLTDWIAGVSFNRGISTTPPEWGLDEEPYTQYGDVSDVDQITVEEGRIGTEIDFLLTDNHEKNIANHAANRDEQGNLKYEVLNELITLHESHELTDNGWRLANVVGYNM